MAGYNMGSWSGQNVQALRLQQDQPFSSYSYMQQPPQPQQPTADERANQLAQQIMGQPANNPMAGMTQMIAGAGMGLRNFQQPENQFPAAPQPAAPGGQTPGLRSMLQNLFSGNHTGGLS
jgi:hypothetical protein